MRVEHRNDAQIADRTLSTLGSSLNCCRDRISWSARIVVGRNSSRKNDGNPGLSHCDPNRALPLAIEVLTFPNQFGHHVPLGSRTREIFLQSLLKDVLVCPSLGRPQRAQPEVQFAIDLNRERHWLLRCRASAPFRHCTTLTRTTVCDLPAHKLSLLKWQYNRNCVVT